MGHSLYIISVFLLYITGSCSSSVVRVEGFVGGSAVFTCSIPESEIKDNIKKFNLHVRDIEGKTVCDIIGGDRTCQGQAPEYKARTEILPNAQKEGNFTIKLNWLKKNDARKYTCIFTGPFQNEIYLELDVKDKPEGIGNHGGLPGRPSFFLIIFSILCALLYNCSVV
ncbi:uncharacterized protein LOC125271627 isoform X3 [Megalobrama amblycephala]|uniref:uncharacterized protein LOC125271627 isoform X3 n=1 Tax=Megalobrama amblycephala TaxID=75352 RepID=UPI0020141CB5|nr:uncharacterized protein LOC125271627 isoform X3 [Megalobrama amblycephala]